VQRCRLSEFNHEKLSLLLCMLLWLVIGVIEKEAEDGV
jgi:hypothetical protein